MGYGQIIARAVLVVSGHWETAEFAVSSGALPGMVFDYYGFPEHLYHIKYDAPGSPELATRIRAMLHKKTHDVRRGESSGHPEWSGSHQLGFEM